MDKKTKAIIWGVVSFIVSFVILTIATVLILGVVFEKCFFAVYSVECLEGYDCGNHQSSPAYCNYFGRVSGDAEILMMVLSFVISNFVYKKIR